MGELQHQPLNLTRPVKLEFAMRSGKVPQERERAGLREAEPWRKQTELTLRERDCD
jgi:hypothetical protein